MEVEQRTAALLQSQVDLESKLKESNERNGMLMAQLVSYKRDSDQQRNLHVAS